MNICQKLFFSITLVACLVSVTGCGWFGSKKAIIDQAVKTLKDRQGEMVALNPAIEKADFYADESGSGVVIEYTFKNTATISKDFTSESARTNLIAQFKDNEAIKGLLAQGVFVRFIFKSSTGDTIADSKIERADL